MCSDNRSMAYTEAERVRLKTIVRRAIEAGLCGSPPAADVWADVPPALCVMHATFVTLKRAGRLRGCIGTLEAHRPVAEDAAHNAYAAAFRDPRFPPLTAAEWPACTWSLSILSAPERLSVADEAELAAVVRPGVDGLIIAEGPRRATFLPSVWIDLPKPSDFIRALKQKAGVPSAYWTDTLAVFRYTTEIITD